MPVVSSIASELAQRSTSAKAYVSTLAARLGRTRAARTRSFAGQCLVGASGSRQLSTSPRDTRSARDREHRSESAADSGLYLFLDRDRWSATAEDREESWQRLRSCVRRRTQTVESCRRS